MFRILSFLLLTCLTVMPVFAGMVSIPATRDATLIEDPGGALANGSGPSLFAGRTGQTANGIRRALIHFDVAAMLPEKALIDRAILTLHLNKANQEQSEVSLHRLLDDWGEGPAYSAGGSGAPAESGDSTWLHTVYDDQYWVQAGGHFIANASASIMVGGIASYAWPSTVNMVNDVRLWLHAPQQNFGWLVMGDENAPRTVNRFDSREGPQVGQHPVLMVEYHLPGE